MITARFFILGMEQLEPDASARQVLTAAGILMILVELLAFGVAALLPRKAMRGLRYKLLALGLCLLAFEAGTLYVTQVSMVRATQAKAQGENTQITALRASIASQRQAAATLRATAEKQAESRLEWVRNMAAKQANQAVAVEAGIAAQAVELAKLESAVHPTLENVLGDHGVIFYALGRSLLIVMMSVVLLAVSGGLLRVRYNLPAGRKAKANQVQEGAERPAHALAPAPYIAPEVIEQIGAQCSSAAFTTDRADAAESGSPTADHEASSKVPSVSHWGGALRKIVNDRSGEPHGHSKRTSRQRTIRLVVPGKHEPG
ncbi:hypothetical protein AWV79_35660 [Cupriavidus sp. UYMMa02A]|nr:hypothetical protein AWV79_35660 [Cupriavidus sp. UYMMa02A]